jgi:hypothetical protein
VLITGARWKDLPTHLPLAASCWRRFHEWTTAGIFQTASMDSNLCAWRKRWPTAPLLRSKKGALASARRSEASTKIMLLVDGHGAPLGVDIASASPAEVNADRGPPPKTCAAQASPEAPL